MIESKTLTSLRDAKANYDSAVRTNMNVNAKKQILQNILLTHAGELIETALDVEDLLKKQMENTKTIAELKKQIAGIAKDGTQENDPAPKKKKNG